MSAPAVPPRERSVVLVPLLILAGAGWLVLVWQSGRMSPAMGAGWAMGMRAPLFTTVWIVMMAAMMFPTAAPMILTFARISAGRRQQGLAFVPAWVFTGAYVLVWTVFGVLAYLAAAGVDRLVSRSMWWTDHAAQLGGAVIALAGLYQFSPLKRACLSQCRTPLSFILDFWRDGYAGAFAMGVRHGAYCLGCCWVFFLILFPLGVMNLAVMMLLTVLIFAEKSLQAGEPIARAAGLGLLAYGILVMLLPRALPAGM